MLKLKKPAQRAQRRDQLRRDPGGLRRPHDGRVLGPQALDQTHRLGRLVKRSARCG